MPLSIRVEPVLVPRLSFGEALEKLWVEQHTGPILFHFAQGVPQAIEIPGEPTRIKLEKR